MSEPPTEPGDDLDAHGGWPSILSTLLDGQDLTSARARAAMRAILDGDATPAQLAGFVVALRAKGETAGELSGLLEAVLERAALVTLPDDVHRDAMDIVGTGGDRSHSVNVSTMAALVTAAAGVPVCKHGNRAASSRCGTADVLEALGVAIELSPAGVARCVDEVGIGFCLAQRFHPAFRFAALPRREMGIPTVFNLLGPMANPARVPRYLLGVADGTKAGLMAESLRAHGVARAWVVHGSGLDELTTTGPSTVLELDGGELRTHTVEPSDVGLPLATRDDLAGGDPTDNARIVRAVLAGERSAARDITVLNAGAALVVAGRASSLADGVELAIETIDGGRASTLLDRFITASQRAARAEANATLSDVSTTTDAAPATAPDPA